MNKLFFIFALLSTLSFSSELNEINEVDCLVVRDENSIICKYINERTDEDRFIDVEWLNPKGEITRNRKILIPSGHGSVYDFRYLNGRMLGTWSFKVTDSEITYTTEFEITNEK